MGALYCLSYSCELKDTDWTWIQSLYSHRTWRLTKALWKGGTLALLMRGQEHHLVAFEILAVNTGSRLYYSVTEKDFQTGAVYIDQ